MTFCAITVAMAGVHLMGEHCSMLCGVMRMAAAVAEGGDREGKGKKEKDHPA